MPSPIPVHNPVHNRFLVTQTQPQIKRLPQPASFLSILPLGGPFARRRESIRCYVL
jgi:hypothetical protein